MITIIFEAHATSVDNVARRASGHHDAPLAEIGEEQARQVRARHQRTMLDAVFCSDLQRSYRTAELAFAGRNLKNLLRDYGGQAVMIIGHRATRRGCCVEGALPHSCEADRDDQR